MRHVDQLLAELETLDGARECAVVRSALEAGVSEPMVLEELEREVQRRRARLEARLTSGGKWPSTFP